ncbi:MAG: general secretion pathway protein GspF, partial [Deltaproteobacteria bacterium]
MSKKNKKDHQTPQPLEGHRLKTRRDFLGQGLIAGLSYAIAPNIFSLFSKGNMAHAIECGAVDTSVMGQKTPIIVFDLSGGANFAGSNVMVGGVGGQTDFLQDYTTLGLPPDFHPSLSGMVNSELGLKFHSDSGFLRGINNIIPTAVRQKVDGGVFCTSSSDDTGNNPHNPMYWLSKAGAAGELTQLAGSRNTETGGRSTAPPQSIDPALQPVIITRPEDALSLVSVGKLHEIFNQNQAQKIMKSIERLSESKLQRLSNMSLPSQIKTLVQCGYIQSNDLINKYNADVLDPRNDALVGMAFNNLGNGDQRKTATIAKLVLDGYIGAGTIEKGGYDYHDKTRATGENRDFQAGELIGRVIQLASLKGKDVMIYVITDGGVAAKAEVDNSTDGRGKYVWTGDSSQRSSAWMLVYRHAG